MPEEEDLITAVEAALGYRFSDRNLLVDALTHRSFAHEKPKQARTDNDRLEFLGDAVLQWSVSTLLCERFESATAGELTRQRADLVCEDGLAAIAVDLNIPSALRLGRGELRSGGRDKPRLLASALEACVAAVFLDGGAQAAHQLCESLFVPRLKHAALGDKDFKSQLQEHLQQQSRPRPVYSVESTSGPDHAREFQVALQIEGETVARGQGRSKSEAEQAAAQLALQELKT